MEWLLYLVVVEVVVGIMKKEFLALSLFGDSRNQGRDIEVI